MHSEERNSCNIENRFCWICDNGGCINEKEIHIHLKIESIIESPRNHSTSDVDDDGSEEQRLQNYIPEKDGASTIDTRVLRPFKCCLCELVFDRISQLDNHKRSVHRQERSQVCQICGKGFFRATDLKTHLNIHLGTNKCMCEVCGKKFNHVSNLIRHSRTHSGVKPYPCTMCGKRFAQINTMARHKAIHVRGDKTLDCCYCAKKYKTENGLKEHMKKLHGFTERSSKECGKIVRRQHYCKICGESFQLVELLRAHETNHQSIKTLECQSCSQMFKKSEEIKEHRCGKRIDSIDANEIPFEEITNDEESYFRLEVSKTNELKNFTDDELDPKLSRNITFTTDKVTEDKQTKETIVYVRAEQLGNMNTEQLVDTANNFLHEHLLELTTESSLQAENMSSGDCENETVVSEMINDCWKEIEIPDVSELAVAEKRIVTSTKHDTENIIYVQELQNDGTTIVSNENDNLHRNICCLDNTTDVKNEQNEMKDFVSNSEMRNAESIKILNRYVKQSEFIQHETPMRKLSVVKRSANKLVDCVSHEKISRNNREQIRKYKRDPNPIVKSIAEQKTQNLRHRFDEEDPSEDNNSSIGITNTSSNQNTFEELFKANVDNVNAIVAKTSENQEPMLRLVQTENIDQFYELLITSSSEKTVNSLEFDNKISTEVIDENLKTTQNDSMPESMLKLVQLENGQCVLELTERESDVVRVIDSRMKADGFEKFIENETAGRTNLSPNKSEKIIYLAQNSRDCLIDLFETETTLRSQEENNFNSISISEELMPTSFDNPQALSGNKNLDNAKSSPADGGTCEDLFGLTQDNPGKLNKQSTGDGKTNIRDNGPMVRLVQNEDGAQFFELIRGDLEFEETQDFELVKMNEKDRGEDCQLRNDVENAKNLGVESTFTVNDTDEKIKVDLDVPRKKKLNDNVKKYNCDVCKKSFSKGYNYRQHIGTHFADQQKFKCKECGTFFAWKSTLNKHIASHKAGGQQKFVCEICPKVYTTLSQVNEHVKRDHLKERNHKCTHCAKTFFKKFDLKIHIRTHTKERPYECRVCYKSFHHQSHIIRHERIHSGERPYACNICEKAFTQLGSLKSHRQRHQELKIDILDYQMDEDDPLPPTTS